MWSTTAAETVQVHDERTYKERAAAAEVHHILGRVVGTAVFREIPGGLCGWVSLNIYFNRAEKIDDIFVDGSRANNG